MCPTPARCSFPMGWHFYAVRRGSCARPAAKPLTIWLLCGKIIVLESGCPAVLKPFGLLRPPNVTGRISLTRRAAAWYNSCSGTARHSGAAWACPRLPAPCSPTGQVVFLWLRYSCYEMWARRIRWPCRLPWLTWSMPGSQDATNRMAAGFYAGVTLAITGNY